MRQGRKIGFVFLCAATLVAWSLRGEKVERAERGHRIATVEPAEPSSGVVRYAPLSTVPVPAAKKGGALSSTHTPCAVNGLVRLPDGKPAVDVEVQLATYRAEPRRGGGLHPTLYFDAQTARTDENGRFRFETGPGDFALFVATDKGASPMIEPISLAPGEEVRDLELVLSPSVALTGLVIDEHGDPAQASVEVRLPDRADRLTSAETLDGAFDLGALPNSPFVIVATSRETGATVERRLARPERDLILRLGPPLGLITFELVGEPDPTAFTEIHVWIGDEQKFVRMEDGAFTYQPFQSHLEVQAVSGDRMSERIALDVDATPRTVRLGLNGAGGVRGRITRADGNPASGFAVVRRRGDDGPVGQHRLDKEGRYDVGPLLPGEYTLRYASGDDSDEAVDEVRFSITAAQALELDLRLSRERRITGTVLDEDGRPATFVGLELIDAIGGSVLAVGGLGSLNRSDLITDENGRFAIAHVRGPVRLRAADYNGRASPIVQASGSGDEEVTLTLLPSGSLDGVLRGHHGKKARVRCAGSVWHDVDDDGEYHLQCGVGSPLEVEVDGEQRSFPIEVDEDEPTYLELRWES